MPGALRIPAALLLYCQTNLNHILNISTPRTPPALKIFIQTKLPLQHLNSNAFNICYSIHSLQIVQNPSPASDMSPRSPFVYPVLAFLLNKSIETCNISVSIICWRTDWKHFNMLPLTDKITCHAARFWKYGFSLLSSTHSTNEMVALSAQYEAIGIILVIHFFYSFRFLFLLLVLRNINFQVCIIHLLMFL